MSGHFSAGPASALKKNGGIGARISKWLREKLMRCARDKRLREQLVRYRTREQAAARPGTVPRA
jgi:hypothetical protein